MHALYQMKAYDPQRPMGHPDPIFQKASHRSHRRGEDEEALRIQCVVKVGALLKAYPPTD